MLTASSPITFPPSSSPPLKRRCPSPSRGNAPTQKPKPRTRGGFMLDDDSDSDQEQEDSSVGPAPKRILIEPCPPAPLEPTDAEPSQAEDPATITDAQRVEPSIDIEEELRYQALFDLPRDAPADDDFSVLSDPSRRFRITTCSGKSLPVRQRKAAPPTSYESMVAERSRTKEGRAKRSYYGVEIHALIDDAAKEQEEQQKAASAAASGAPIPPAHHDEPVRSVEDHIGNSKRPKKTLLWTEKYRARKFMDLVGDDHTNRQVLRWLKLWDPLVFPHAAKSKAASRRAGAKSRQPPEEEKPHQKILMLTGPPGLGKTTLAHVSAKQAGYEVLEINASDDRSCDVVKGRIRTSLGTENVKTVEQSKSADGKPQKIARPVCVVVDEVDGVVSGSGGSGDGGFVKSLIDLVMTDQKNSASANRSSAVAAGNGTGRRGKKKGDDFRQMRPLILICNDVYHVSLRPLRQSGLAEIIHVGKPTIDAVVTRLKNVFEKEGIPCEKDAARKLCEAAWGMTSGIDARRGAESTVEGDLRGIMVVGEWVAGRFRASVPSGGAQQLSRQWVEQNVVQDLAHGGGGARGLGRGGTRDVVARVFQEGAGFPKQNVATTNGGQISTAEKKTAERNMRREQPQAQLGFAEQQKKQAMVRLAEMVETSGEVDRIVTEVLAEYPSREFNDDCYLTKPNEAYEWLHFHDACSTRIFSGQEWELAPYLSQPVLACHHLFASPRRHVVAAGYDKHWGASAGADDAEGATAAAPVPFSGPRADYEAREAEKHNRSVLQAIQAQLSPTLSRSFRSPEQVATDFLSYLVRMVSPDVKPVVINGGGGADGGNSNSNNKWGGSVASVRREGEKAMVRRAAEVLADVGIELLKGRIEDANPSMMNRTQWVYRMEPDLDALATFETMGAYVLAAQAPTRYAVRQVLDQELRKTLVARENAARQARFRAGAPTGMSSAASAEEEGFDKVNLGHGPGGKNGLPQKAGGAPAAGPGSAVTAKAAAAAAAAVAAAAPVVKRDFFGRVMAEKKKQPLQDVDGNARPPSRSEGGGDGGKRGGKQQPGSMVWVTFNEGLNNAVRKPISLEEFLRGL